MNAAVVSHPKSWNLIESWFNCNFKMPRFNSNLFKYVPSGRKLMRMILRSSSVKFLCYFFLFNRTVRSIWCVQMIRKILLPFGFVCVTELSIGRYKRPLYTQFAVPAVIIFTLEVRCLSKLESFGLLHFDVCCFPKLCSNMDFNNFLVISRGMLSL